MRAMVVQSIPEAAEDASPATRARYDVARLSDDSKQNPVDDKAALMIYTSGTTGRPKGDDPSSVPCACLLQVFGVVWRCARTSCQSLRFGTAAGVVHTHGSLAAQMTALHDAWGWSTSDRILHALPLHHIHGAVVALHTAHAAGACVEFLPRFSPSLVWRRLMVRIWKRSSTARRAWSADVH